VRVQNLNLTVPAVNLNVYKFFCLVGILTVVAGFFLAPVRIWSNLLLVSFSLIALGLSGLLFIAIQYATSAGWCVVFRRVAEAMTALIPIGGIGIIAILILHPSIYPWYSDPAFHGTEHLGFKQHWLSLPFFIGRAIFYIITWTLFSRAIIRNSRLQDEDASPLRTKSNVRLSAFFIVVFALTFWLASFDWIMSLEPKWFSTMFGVYNFAGMFQSGLAVIIILVVWLKEKGPFQGLVTGEHLHDLGKLLFAFSTFWMYIWFCQYMLIWYANIPEEAVYFTKRMHGAWKPLMFLNLFLNWVVPFFALLSSRTKRNPIIITRVAIAVLVGRWLDLYLMIFPSSFSKEPVAGFWEAGLILGTIGLAFMMIKRKLDTAPIIPTSDPYLSESIHHHQ